MDLDLFEDRDGDEIEIELKVYAIPKNVKTRIEFFTGFGFRELGVLFLGFMIGLSLGMILWLFQGSPLWMGFAVPTGFFGFLLSKPDPRTGRNILNLLKDIRRFNGKPKRYFYRFGDGRGA